MERILHAAVGLFIVALVVVFVLSMIGVLWQFVVAGM
jgi:hypothetical protein